MTVRVIVGLQYGNEGKGKIADFCSTTAEVIFRVNGGGNAGHTVKNDLGEFTLHLLPSGIFNPAARCVLGNGMAIDPDLLIQELKTLRVSRVPIARFSVSSRAHLVMPWHKLADAANELARGDDAIGTTGRGIGPCYADKINRIGLRVGELLNYDRLVAKVEELRLTKLFGLSAVAKDALAQIGDGRKLAEDIRRWSDHLGGCIADTDELARSSWRHGKKILLETAQGAMIDIECGIYPYVTSSCATSAGAAVGSGLPPMAITEVIGVAKAYLTRTGNGPLPTELLDDAGEILRKTGREFDSTTGRPRRCGWFDVPQAKYAAEANGATGIILTKLDTLSALPRLRVCTGYRSGNDYLSVPPETAEDCQDLAPVYDDLPGWNVPIAGVRDWDKLPAAARRYVECLEEHVGVKIVAVSTGPHRDALIQR